jgi:hypothetical protein
MATFPQVLQAMASKIVGKFDRPTPPQATALVAINPDGTSTTKTLEEVAGDFGDELAALTVQPVTAGYVYIPTADGKFAKIAAAAVDADESANPF